MAKKPEGPKSSTDQFLFYIITQGGVKVLWEDLTQIAAVRMNRSTELHAPSNILKFGWARMPAKDKE
jgi:hypothetical protein